VQWKIGNAGALHGTILDSLQRDTRRFADYEVDL
jgi:hypothetical protein